MSTTPSNPWEVRETDFRRAGTSAEQLRFLLQYAVLAPSGHNTQPWLFKIDGDAVELYADRTRALPVVDPDDRELTISCGAALFQLRIALRHFGYAGVIATLPDADDPDLLARIRLGNKRDATTEEHALFDAICKRRTNRQVFEQREVPAEMLIALQQEAHAEGVWLSSMQTMDDRNAIADLIALGDRMQWADKTLPARTGGLDSSTSRSAQRWHSHVCAQLRESDLLCGSQGRAHLRSGRWTGCKRSPDCYRIPRPCSAWDRCGYGVRLAPGRTGVRTDTLVCTLARGMGLVLESTHRGPRGAAHAAQGHRASRLPAVTFALRLRTGGPTHASSQRERGALVMRMIHVFTSATRPIRAAAKTAIFFLKVFPMMPSRPVDWVTRPPVIEKVRYPTRHSQAKGDLYRPSAGGPHPGVVICLGVVPFGVDPELLRNACTDQSGHLDSRDLSEDGRAVYPLLTAR
jgi:hypothetical protein